MTADALLPVGRDCDCGFPLVWRRGEQVCAVYGSHPPPNVPLRMFRADAESHRQSRRRRREMKAAA